MQGGHTNMEIKLLERIVYEGKIYERYSLWDFPPAFAEHLLSLGLGEKIKEEGQKLLEKGNIKVKRRTRRKTKKEVI